ncbi:MAG TPA: thymidylate synthase [Actinocrinis sp.]|uniref:thymidylate synthase n=1 Tax=Actinocrinis sp. TaxID=1920516 RepID=UPI002DDCB0D6|nr:thymidylate synthase [Actinocrinis sp.]HEV2342909.1 thymidylate synthase [Actinocrinis sp.]
MTDTFATFQDAYLHHLRASFEQPEFTNSPRGQDSFERLGVSFRLTDPAQRHIRLPARKTNLVFNFAEALWYLSGTDDLAHIAYYAPNMVKYSADGTTLAGTAYGTRIFRHRGGLDQWRSVQETLAADRDSKRAVIQIFEADELTVPGNIDVACTLALQFMIRDDRLHAVGFMRANDAFRGVVSDVFSFTFLLEVMARQLGLEIGTYTHHVGSFHVYKSDADWVNRVLDQDPGDHDGEPFPAMPHGDVRLHLEQVLDWERALRLDDRQLDADRLQALDLPEYWRHVLGLFELYRQIKHGTHQDPRVLDLLPAVYRDTVITRWPGLAAAHAVR